MYVRFSAFYKSKAKEINGVFSIIGYLFENVTDKTNTGKSEDEKRLWELNNWFKYNLKLPNKIRRNRNEITQPTAVSWFKDSAKEHIKNLQEISDIIERHGAVVEFIYTENPGYILYQDEYQVFAEPVDT